MNPFDTIAPAVPSSAVAPPKPSAPAANPFDSVAPAASDGAAPPGFDGLKKLWVKAGGDPATADVMAHVAESESSGNASATGPEYSDASGKHHAHGLWQISDVHGNQNWNDPLTNAREAVALQRESGMSPWESSRNAGGGSGNGGWGQYASGAAKPATVAAAVVPKPKPKPKPAEPDRWQPAKDFFASLNRPIAGTAEAAEPGNPFDAPSVVAPIAVAKPKRSLVDAIATGTSEAAGGGLKNLSNLGSGVLEAVNAPRRGYAGFGKYVEDNKLENGALFTHPGALGAALQQGGKWAGNAKRDDSTDAYDRNRISTADGGFIPTDEQINAHLHGFPATAARWGAKTASTVLLDPVSAIPAGAIGKVAGAIPGAARAAEAISASGVGRGASRLFNAEHHLGGLTEHGQNVVEGVRNTAAQAAEHAKRGEDLIISTARKDIKAGNISKPVADLVQRYNLTPLVGPQKPSELRRIIDEARHSETAAKTTEELRKLDLIEGGPQNQIGLFGSHAPGMQPADLFKDPAKAAEARAGVAEHIKPETVGDDWISKGIAKTNNQLKGMFLAVPIPHVGNLINLAYNKYGMATTLRGLAYAAQESTGLRRAHFSKLVGELQKAGADNQYGKIYSELNDVGGGSVRQVQRFANAAQDKILNPVERGLRASMMERELGAGKQGFDAARNIHKALGTDAATGMTKALNKLPLSQFPRFHTQTALGSTLRTLRENPGRITGFEHAMGGPDQKKDGQAHYHFSTPTASGLKAIVNPLGYLSGASTLGNLAGVSSSYSTIGLLNKARSEWKKGQKKAATRDYQKAAGTIGSAVTPMAGSVAALSELARKKRGEQRETGIQDLTSSLGGGYWSKQ